MGKFIILFCFLINGLLLHASIDISLRKLTFQDGLSDNTINAIIQDQDGFMWFATDNGFNRYDGYNITPFKVGDQQKPIIDICDDKNNLLWCISSDSVYCFNRQTEEFVNFTCDISLSGMKKIYIIENYVYLLSINGKLYQLRMEDNQGLISWRLWQDYVSNLGREYVFSMMCPGEADDLFAVTYSGEILQIDGLLGKIIFSKKLDVDPIWLINSLFYDNGQLWLSTMRQGIFIYNLEKDKQEHYIHTEHLSKPLNVITPHTISHQDVYAVTKVNDGQYIAATWNGFTIFTPDEGGEYSYTTKVYNGKYYHTLQNVENHMVCVFYSPSGVLWIGTMGGGVAFTDVKNQFYDRYTLTAHDEICSIVRDDENYLYLSTYHKGILKSTAPFNGKDNLDFEELPIVGLDGPALYSCKISDRIWIGGRSPYLIEYNLKTKRSEAHYIDINTSIEGEYLFIRDIVQADSNTLWLATCAGLLKYDPHKKVVTERYFGYNCIKKIIDIGDGNLWLGTKYGLCRYNYQTNETSANYENKININTTYIDIQTMALISNNRLAVGYKSGLAIISLKDLTLLDFFNTNNGLPNNFIGTLVEDNQGDLWIGTDSGLSRYSTAQNAFFHYYISGSNRSALLYDDYLFLGNNMSLTYFNFKEIKLSNETVKDVLITGIEINGKSVGVGESVKGQVVLDKSAYLKENLFLEKGNNSFAITFSNMSFSDVQKYQYRLYPVQKEWIEVDGGWKALYTNMDKGEYKFEVRSIDADGLAGNISSLVVVVHPQWYETVFFRILIGICIALIIVYFIVRSRKEQRRLLAEKELRYELRMSNAERKRAEETAKEQKRFFINISHELRTPLTLIQSPLQSILSQKDLPKPAVQELEQISTNVSSLSNIIDQFLNLYKIESGLAVIKQSPTDIISLVEKETQLFLRLASEREIEIALKVPVSHIIINIDSRFIKLAVRNLISNAIKYTPNGGSVDVEVSKVNIDDVNYCRIEVSDTGYGISEEMMSKIFDPFITGDRSPEISTQVGLGLQIVKNVIELHKGQVKLESEVGVGSRFTLLIPALEINTAENDKTDAVIRDNQVNDLSESTDKSDENTILKNKVLVVEDNIEIRQYIRRILEADYIVTEAGDGVEGVEKTISEQPDIIIMDIMMPNKNGFEASAEIKKQKETSHIPIIMLTAVEGDEYLIKSSKIGVDTFLNKPFNPQVLKAKIESLILNRSQLKRIYAKSLNISKEDDDDNDAIPEFMQEIINLIEENLSDPDFSVKKLADLLNLSQPSLYRRIKDYSNQSASAIIRNIRMIKAANLILEGKYQIQEVALMVGYNDIKSFRKHFVDQFGVKPSELTSL